MENLGGVVENAGEFVLSASGSVGCRRGPWSPSGFESMLRTSDPSAAKPVFQSLHNEHVSSESYVPDPFDRYTASGRRIFNLSLEKAVADADFIPLCWFRSRPLVVGIVAADPNRIRPEPKPRVVLRGASTNTFRPTGDVVTIDLGTDFKSVALPTDLKGGRLRLIAHDAGECVLYAWRSFLAVVPLADLRPGTGSFLTARLTGGESLLAGRESILEVTPTDPLVTVRTAWLPAGMQASGSGLRWQPSDEQIGPTKIVVNIAHGGIEQLQTFELSVQRPSLALPVDPLGCAATADCRMAVIWEGFELEGAPQPRRVPAGSELMRLATIDLTSGTARAEKRLLNGEHQVAVIGGRVLILKPNSERCDVLDLVALERMKTLIAAGPILGVGGCPGAIGLQSESSLDVFDATSLERRPRHAASALSHLRLPTTTSTLLTPAGVVADGVLLDAAGKLALLIQPTVSPALPGANGEQRPAFRSSSIRPLAGMYPMPTNRMETGGSQRFLTRPIPESQATATLEQRWTNRQMPKAPHTYRWNFDLLLEATGDRPFRTVLVKLENSPIRSVKGESVQAALCATRDAVVATYARRLYRVPLPAPVGGGTTAVVSIVPRQTAFVRAADCPTLLQHSAAGGRPPLKFSLPAARAGVSIDEVSGTVTVERQPVLDEAVRSIEKILRDQRREGSFVDAYRQLGGASAARIAALIGRKSTGLPVMVPIRVAVSDAEGLQDTLSYDVFAAVRDADILPQLQKLDAARANETPAVARVPGTLGRGPQDDAAMAHRIDAIEQRLDLMTRQVKDILRRLDNK